MQGRRPPDDPAKAAQVELNMTPMIDIVFQLVVFLMIANDMSRKEIEELVLPVAMHAKDDDGVVEKDRLIVNLLKDPAGGPPSLKVGGRDMDLAVFRQLLGAEAARARDLYVLIRADRESRWQDVQWVMQECAHPSIRIRRVQFATTETE